MPLLNEIQETIYQRVASTLPVDVDYSGVEIIDGDDYVESVVAAHDYQTGLAAVFGAVVEAFGRQRGLPAQTMTVDRRLAGLHLNHLQLQFINGAGLAMDDHALAPDNGSYLAKDGRYVTTIGLHGELQRRLYSFLECAPSTEAMGKAIAEWDAQELEDIFAKQHLPMGMVRTPQEWAESAIGQQVDSTPLIQFRHETGAAPARPLGQASRRPLEGVRVLDLSTVVAAPTAGKLLAEQGADVIRVSKSTGLLVYPIFLDAGWGRRNIRLDFRRPSDMSILLDLIQGVDVVLSNTTPGGLEKYGLGEKALREINPNLILAELSFAPHGIDEYWANRKGFEQVAQAVSGLIHVHNESVEVDDPKNSPAIVPALINDFCTGFLCATGIISALHARELQGGSWHVGTSLLRNATEAVKFQKVQDKQKLRPVDNDDFIKYGIDQETPLGVFTRLTPLVEFSHTPSKAYLPTSLPGTSPRDTTWFPKVDTSRESTDLPHYPSKLAREGGLVDLISTHGIEDRGDGKGKVSFLSNSLMGLAVKQWAQAVRAAK